MTEAALGVRAPERMDRDPELVERYREDPRGTVEWWEAERANQLLSCTAQEASTWLRFADDEREADQSSELAEETRDTEEGG